jgi:hypothetical protein
MLCAELPGIDDYYENDERDCSIPLADKQTESCSQSAHLPTGEHSEMQSSCHLRSVSPEPDEHDCSLPLAAEQSAGYSQSAQLTTAEHRQEQNCCPSQSVSAGQDCEEQNEGIVHRRVVKLRKRILVNETDDDDDEEASDVTEYCNRPRISSDEDITQRPKIQRRRWTEVERELVMRVFGNDITNKRMPSGARLVETSRNMGTRTVAQLRTYINNHIKGKMKL